MSKDSFIPNTFQTPNAVIDRIMFLLSESEFKVLMYAIRHILGWQHKRDRKQAAISLSNFEGGFTYESPDGETFEYFGTGLTRGTIMSALKALVKYKILEKGEQTSDGQIWRLRFMIHDDVDIAGLTLRHEAKKNKGRKQTAKARAKAKESVQQTSNEADDSQSVQQTDVVCSTDLTGLSNRHNETNGKEHSKDELSATQSEPHTKLTSDEHDAFMSVLQTAFNLHGGRAWDVYHQLRGSVADKKKHTKRFEYGGLFRDKPVTLAELKSFPEWYSQQCADCDLPIAADVLEDWFGKFRQSATPKQVTKIVLTEPLNYPPLTGNYLPPRKKAEGA